MVATALLRSHMVKHSDTQAGLAKDLGLSLSRVNAKIHNTSGAEFKQSEIALIKKKYGLSAQEIDDIFFDPKMY